MKDNKVIQVCDKCLKASCWYGEFMCEDSYDTDVRSMTVGELKKLDLESSDYWSDECMKKVYGESDPFKIRRVNVKNQTNT